MTIEACFRCANKVEGNNIWCESCAASVLNQTEKIKENRLTEEKNNLIIKKHNRKILPILSVVITVCSCAFAVLRFIPGSLIVIKPIIKPLMKIQKLIVGIRKLL